VERGIEARLTRLLSSCFCLMILLDEFRRICPLGIGRDESGEDLDECSFYIDACNGGEW